MNDYTHITKMENIMKSHEDALQSLEKTLDFFQNHMDDYKSLIEYYYSAQRNQDLSDDENHLIPDDLSRGVLSEDGIFDLITDYYDAGIRMIELGLQLIKNR